MCNMRNAISSSILHVHCLFLSTLRPRLGKWHCFLQGKSHYCFGFCFCRDFTSLLPPESKIVFQASSDVRSMNVLL